jgi:aminomuconate-semialdehyde/2-hydroxymuconate-6-semialdehyde dehydrogenase
MVTLENYIGGELLAPIAGEYVDNVNPAIAEVFSKIPRSTQADLDAAIVAAKKAQQGWANLSAEERGDMMLKISQGILANLEELAAAETEDNGKPLWLAKAVDIPRAASNFKFFGQAITQFSSEAHSMQSEAINYTLRKPLGIVGCISPWNLPLYLFTWKIAPALAAGNCVIAKPSEVTPYSAYLLSKICIEAGLPAGVLNIVHGFGYEIGDKIVSHADVKAISFTGGTVTGKHIASVAAPMFKKLSLELGGKNASIVFDDCDWDNTLDEVARAAFSNQGQICLCGSRILIQKSIYKRFRDALVEKVKQLNVGDPLDANSKQGAVVSEAHMNKVLQSIETAKSEGGNILCGGKRVNVEGRCANGFFIQPTLIENLDAYTATNQQEIFGPVASLIPFEDEAEAIEIANSTDYGLAFSVWSQNISRCTNLSQQLEAGIIWINCWMLRDLRTPFGGVKNSGVGREGGFEALKFFTEPTNVCIKY